ncbi:MAG: hypothetical protein MSC45_07500 [Mobiluncus sp.]|uniref:hypothetical protein n=1 Tax=Mobiluncus sp. TaxID=47293 RepID=UPI00258F3BB9|nr:hypothetical protein [Mobiluncus sp.]MCI6584896.1 hypothetical protein [Mobiluncus sp.]
MSAQSMPPHDPQLAAANAYTTCRNKPAACRAALPTRHRQETSALLIGIGAPVALVVVLALVLAMFFLDKGHSGKTEAQTEVTPTETTSETDGAEKTPTESATEKEPETEKKPSAEANPLDGKIAAAKAAGKQVFTGTVQIMPLDKMADFQAKFDAQNMGASAQALNPNSETYSNEYGFLFLSPTQSITAGSGDGMGTSTRNCNIISLGYRSSDKFGNTLEDCLSEWQPHNGKTVTVAIAYLQWPSDTSLPIGAPSGEVEVLG